MLTHIDCFAGVGGVATGFHAAGTKTVLAIEKVESCVDTYRENHPNVKVINNDIRHVSVSEIVEICGSAVDIVTAGMPCETFSTAGASSRSFYDHRQTLFEEAIRIAEAVNAKVILFENVPGFANKKLTKGGNKLVIDFMKDSLAERGFSNIFITTLNARDYGVPQSRNRLFILASKDSSLNFTDPPKLFQQSTVGDAFFNLPRVDTTGPKTSKKFLKKSNFYCDLMADSKFWNLQTSKHCTYQKSPNHRERTIKRFELIRTGEGLKSLFDRLSTKEVEKLQADRILPKKWYIQRNRRLNAKDVSPTVTSHCLDELLHPLLNRSITVREAARLQSFPDAYNFVGGPEICPHIYETQDKYEQIGDAVPPLMAYHWANHLNGVLNACARRSEKQTNRPMCETV